MEPNTAVKPKPSFLRKFAVRVLLICVVVVLFRFAYVVTIAGESCNLGDFCFFSLPESVNFVAGAGKIGASAIVVKEIVRSRSDGSDRPELWTTKEFRKTVDFYSAVFQDLIAEGYLSPNSKTLCVETSIGQDVYALKEIGVSDAVGIAKKASKPLVKAGLAHRMVFNDYSYDFVFSGGGAFDKLLRQSDFASEAARILVPEGLLVIHTSSNDTYSLNSFLALFNSFELVRYRDIQGFDSSMPYIREFVMKKVGFFGHTDGDSGNNCSVSDYKHELVRNAENLIMEEPLKPWITLKRNVHNIKYLSSMADINFKRRYVYVDVGARSYGSSIGSWFKKQYPKQNKTFEVYAIEADKAFHEEYKTKKGVNLLPYAAWVRNETLFFEVNRDPGKKNEDEPGMGRIKPVQSSSKGEKIHGFDFANWLKNTVSERDFVVMKMDVEGTEFDLIPRLFETGAICLIDEIFLECHYNRWQRCCPGERTPKYQKTYDHCMELFTTLRQNGVLVHQWF